jgi:hypothetical protein
MLLVLTVGYAINHKIVSVWIKFLMPSLEYDCFDYQRKSKDF